jgi:BirA family biotin operon repressor/biotin-[acetyl-CoA-carboxylase] ligase
MSVLLRPKLSPADAPLITLLAGLSAQEALRQQTGCAADLRWPNDLLLGGRKLGGILTEMHAEPGRIHFVIVGIGLNVNQSRFPEKLASIATSLKMETGRTHSRLELLLRLLQQFESDYNRFLGRGAADLLSRFAAASSFAQGKRVRITDGNESFTGVTAGLQANGLLLVQRDDGRVSVVVSGDVAEVS